MQREVLPEILDELPDSDPRAVRSRRDLRLINGLMGNERWIERTIARRASEQWALAELGAGKGELTSRLADGGRVTCGYDLVGPPTELPTSAQWQQGNFFHHLANDAAEVVVGSLILHHFQDDGLLRLGELLRLRRLLVFAEPLRSRLALAEGRLLFPLVNEVTRHDMMVSIRAGFTRGELPEKLGLTQGWRWQETTTKRGGLRSVAVRESEII